MTHSGLLAFLFLAFAAPAILSSPSGPDLSETKHSLDEAPLQELLLDCPEEKIDMIENGDFGSGTDPNVSDDPGLSPNLMFVGGGAPLVDGSYAMVNDNFSAWAPDDDQWINAKDNSPDPNGYALIAASSETGKDTIWQQTFFLCEGSDFEFNFDAFNLSDIGTPVPEPDLMLVINGGSLVNWTIPQNGNWESYSHSFQASIGDGETTIALVNNTEGSPGNDLALDNLTLETCAPSLSISYNNPPVCPGDPVAIFASIGSGYASPSFQWQVSVNGGEFENVGGPTSDNFLNVDNVRGNAAYRVLAAPTEVSLVPGGCAIVSDPMDVPYQPDINCGSDVIINITEELCDGQLGANLVEGGDFGSGQDTLGPALDAGITTLLHNSVDSFPQQSGQYVIAGVMNQDPCNGQYPEPCWTSFERDSTDSTGYRMVIDANEEPAIFFQGEVDSLCENTTYQFSVEVLNMAAEFFAPEDPDFDTEVVLPNIDLLVVPIGTPLNELQTMEATFNSGDIPNDTSVTTVGFTFEMAPGESEIMIAVRNNGLGGFGNDLAIDNVRVSVCGPPSQVTYEMTCPDPPPPLTLTAEINGDQMGDDPAIQWIKYDNQSGNWEELDGENGETLDLVVYPPGEAYAFYVAAGPNELLMPNCRIQANPAVIEFLPPGINNISSQICTGESLTVNGITFDQTTDTTMVLPQLASNGCDSVINIDLIVSDTLYASLVQSICPGDSVMVGDTTIFDPGVYEIGLLAQAGCDSIVTLTLNLSDGLLVTTDETICEGDSVLFNGNYYSTTGIYRDTVFSSGCDTIQELDLTVDPAPRRDEDITLCPGDMFMGIAYYSDTTITENIPAPSGCDSIITYNLDLGPLSGFSIEGSTIICSVDGNVVLDAGDQASTYLWSTGEITQTITVDAEGTYSVEVSDGTCTTDDSVEVTIGDMEITVNALPPLCPGEDSGSITVENANGGVGPYTYTLNGTSQSEPVFSNLAPGSYTLEVESGDGCLATEEIVLDEAPAFDILMEGQISINSGESVQLNPIVLPPGTLISGGSWSPSTGLSCTNCLNPIASPNLTTTYTLTLLNDRGCVATSQVTIEVGESTPFYAPNAFSPNGDGQNEFFTIYGNESVVQINNFQVYDRWGAKVFEQNTIPPNDETLGWNGMVNGRESPVGVYVYFAEIVFSDNTSQILKGDVLLMR